jgi:hypothetical protein
MNEQSAKRRVKEIGIREKKNTAAERGRQTAAQGQRPGMTGFIMFYLF